MTMASLPKNQPEIVSAEQGRRTPQIARITLVTCLIFWVFVFNDSNWGPLLAPLATHLQISLATAGLLYVSWSTGYLPGALVGGAMLDRYGPRRVSGGAILWICGGILCILLGMLRPDLIPLWVLLAMAGLAGIGGGVIDACTNGLISAVYAERRGVALNMFNLLYPPGGVIVLLIDAGLLATFHSDPRPAFLFTLAFTLLALLTLPGLPQDAVPSMAPAELPHRSQAHGRPLIVQLAPILAVMVLTAGISSSVRTWAPAYLHVAFAQAPAPAAALSSFAWVLAALSRLGAAALILWAGSWRTIMLGILVASCGLIALLLSPNAVIATLAIAVVSIGVSPLFATCLAVASEWAGHSPGSVAGLLLCAGGSSTVVCGWLFGLLLNTSGPRWAVLFCLCLLLLACLMACRLRSKRAGSQPS
jgi:MFS family permease